MKTAPVNGFQKLIYYRLIALWVVCEAFLGGIIHGLKLPVSGLLVGSCAVICICLIAYYVPDKTAILKATVLVVIFKMMLSPQSPFPAYIAVLFQGLIGQLLFINKRWFNISCILFAVLSLFESAVQRVLVLTILYGNGFWKAVNAFMNGITGQKEVTNYSLLMVSAYVLMHIAVGILTGWIAIIIVRQSSKWQKDYRAYIFDLEEEEPEAIDLTAKPRKNKILKSGLFIIWIILILLGIQSWLGPGKPLLPSALPLQILIRSILIILTWYFLVSPLLLYFFKKWVKRQEARSGTDIKEVLMLLPSTKFIVEQSWAASRFFLGLVRWKHFGRIVLVNILYTSDEP
jgi:hypothetical protein